MVRILIALAIGYGICWCYNNVDFNALKNDAINKVKNEKTIRAVTQGRQINADAVNEALGR